MLEAVVLLTKVCKLERDQPRAVFGSIKGFWWRFWRFAKRDRLRLILLCLDWFGG